MLTTSRASLVVGHLMSCSSSATSASLLEHRVLRTLATRTLYQQTLEHFLTFAAKRSLPMDTALTIYSNAQYMFLVHASPLMAALMHSYHQYSKHGSGKLPRFRRCLRGWKFLTPDRTRKVFSYACGCPIAAKLVLAGRRRMGAFFLVTLCSYARPSELLPLRARQLVPPTSSVTSSWSLLIARHCTVSPSSWSVSGATGWKRSCPFCKR